MLSQESVILARRIRRLLVPLRSWTKPFSLVSSATYYTRSLLEGPHCVMPSLLCRKLSVPSLFRKTGDEQWRQQLKTKWATNGHKCLAVHRILTRLISLNALFVSTRNNPQSSVVDFPSCIAWTLWTAPWIPALSPARSWSYWHSIIASGAVTSSTILAKIRLQVSLTPTGRTPGCLSSAIRRSNINTR